MIHSVKLYIRRDEQNQLFFERLEFAEWVIPKLRKTALNYTHQSDFLVGANPQYLSFANVYCNLSYMATGGGVEWDRNPTFTEIKAALQRIEAELKIPLSECSISSLEVGITFPTSAPAECYFPCLGEVKNYRRAIVGNTLYYNSQNKSYKDRYGLKLYNKGAEQRAHKAEQSEYHREGNFTRFEATFKQKRLKQLLPKKTADSLLNEDNYNKLVKAMEKAFLRITPTGENPGLYEELRAKITPMETKKHKEEAERLMASKREAVALLDQLRRRAKTQNNYVK